MFPFISLQVNFLVCQVLALFFASFFRSYLHPSNVAAGIRHAFGLTLGLLFGYICFGQQAIHIAGLPALCYIIIRTQNPQIVQRYASNDLHYVTYSSNSLCSIHFIDW